MRYGSRGREEPGSPPPSSRSQDRPRRRRPAPPPPCRPGPGPAPPRTPSTASSFLLLLGPDLDSLALVAFDGDDLARAELAQAHPEGLRVVALAPQVRLGVFGQALEQHLRQPQRQVDGDLRLRAPSLGDADVHPV